LAPIDWETPTTIGSHFNVTSSKHEECLRIRRVTLHNIKYRTVYIMTASATSRLYKISRLVNPQFSKPKLNLPNVLT